MVNVLMMFSLSLLSAGFFIPHFFFILTFSIPFLLLLHPKTKERDLPPVIFFLSFKIIKREEGADGEGGFIINK